MSSSRIKNFLSVEYNQIRLKSAFGVIQLITVFGLIVFGFGPIFMPEFFPWIKDLSAFIYLLLGIFVYHLVVLILVKTLKKDNLWIYTGYIWSLVYIIVIYLTGGPDSNLIFLLVFIPIISVSQLDPKLTRNTGIFSIIIFASIIFWDKQYYSDSIYIVKHFLNVIGYSIIVLYVYNLVKDALLEKYEKEQLKRKFVELSELDQVKQMFLTAMSHQLRTPLSGAKWALGNVLESQNCTDRELLQESYNKINTSINIIGEMLKTAEFDIGQGRIKIKKERIDIVEILNKISENLFYMTKSNGSLLSVDIKDKNIFLQADKKMLDLALTNVVDNAIRYSPHGHIEITAFRERDDIKIKIKDDGIGIESSDLEYIFQKFYRGKNAMAIDPNESGVGLYATKKIIEMHGGKIGLSSLVGKGTEVNIELPVV